jgi:transcription elongation factor Elf1
MGMASAKTACERHQPEQTLLYQVVEAHYPTLVDQLAQQGKSLPDHVHREFEAYPKCGQLEHSTEIRSTAERNAAMTWAQRLKRVFNIDIVVCGRCGGSVRVIACTEDQDVINRILAHLDSKEQKTPALATL